MAVAAAGCLLGLTALGLGAGHHLVVHLVGAVGQTKRALAVPHLGEGEPLRDACGTVHLDRLVDDVAALLRHHRLDGADPHACLCVAEGVHRLGGTEHHQAHRLDLDASTGDDFHVLAEVDELLAEALTVETTVDHHLDGALGRTDGAHAVVNTSRPEAELRDLEAAALAPEDVRLGYAHIGELDVHVPVRCIVLAEHVHRPDDLHTGGIDRDEDLRLLLVRVSVRVRLDHGDHDLAAGVARTRDVELLAVDDPLVAVEHRKGADLLRVGGHHTGLRHGIRGADLSVEQRLEPLCLLLGRADTLEDFHVARVRCGAVEALRGQTVLAEFVGDVGIVEVRETLAGVGVREEEVPEPRCLCLRLRPVEKLELAGCPAPALGAVLSESVELLGDRLNLVADECLHRFVQWYDLGGHPQVEVVHAGRLQCAPNHVAPFG